MTDKFSAVSKTAKAVCD